MAKIAEPSELMFTNAEPKMAFRFLMDIEGIPTFMISKTDRPKATTGVVTIPHVNVERYVKGKTKWSPISIELIDYITPSAMQVAMEWFRLTHESVTGRDGSKSAYAKDISIRVLGSYGEVVEGWTLKGAWPSDFDPGSLDWGSEEFMKVTLPLVYDYAINEF